MPRIDVETIGLTGAAGALVAAAGEIDSVRADFAGRMASARAVAPSPADAALAAFASAWARVLAEIADSVSGFARNTDAAAGVYVQADRLPAPKPARAHGAFDLEA